jgi:protein SCO1
VLVAYDEWSSELTGGTLDHPARVHLIDRNGVVREIYSLSYFDERQAVIDVLTLADEPAS